MELLTSPIAALLTGGYGARDFLFDIGLPPDPLYVGLATAGILFAFAAGTQALWRYVRGKR